MATLAKDVSYFPPRQSRKILSSAHLNSGPASERGAWTMYSKFFQSCVLSSTDIAVCFRALSPLYGTGVSILAVEQNAKAPVKFARQAIVFEDGRIVASGVAHDLMNDPRVIQVYVRPGTDRKSVRAVSGMPDPRQ